LVGFFVCDVVFCETSPGDVVLLWQRNGMGLATGIDLDALVDAGDFICEVLNRKTESKVARALTASKKTA
jgi:hydroxymethylglutaryl-CoA lyase